MQMKPRHNTDVSARDVLTPKQSLYTHVVLTVIFT